MRHPPPYPNTTTRSPPRSRFRHRETEETHQPNPKRSCRPVLPDRSRPLSLNRNHYEHDCAGKQLSEFNDSLPRRRFTSEKYQWANLMSSRVGSENENVVGKTQHSLCFTDPNNNNNNRDNGTFSSNIYHLGVHGIEVVKNPDASFPCRTQTFQSKGKGGCVITNPSLIRLKDNNFNEILYRDVVGFSRAKDLVPDHGDGYDALRSNEVPDNSRPEKFMRDSTLDSIIDKIEDNDACNSHREDMRDGWMLDHNLARDQYQDGEYSGCRSSKVSRGSEDLERVGEDSGSRGFLVEHGLNVELDDGRVHVGEDYGFDIDGDSGSHEEVLNMLPYSEKMLEAEELDVQDFSRNWISYDDVYDLTNVDGQCTAEDLEQFSVLKNYVQEHSDELVKPSIKERLGPVQNIKERLRYSSRHFIKPCNQITKKRPGPLSFSCVKNREQNKLARTNLDDFNDGALGDDFNDANMTWSRMEPLEDSERFEQLVQIAFLKFVKALHENPAQQSKFSKQGRISTLKCSVCGSNSKEFVDTLSLLQHAFMCKGAGLRAEHLGFHRALCVLIGWSYEATPNGFWVRQTLSNAEALAVKEDLIIWPPVVFVHNSSIVNANPDERTIVSIEKLKAIIKGMGFDRGMTKVCRGKAANQSNMVVNFHGTLSGLQEAEKLHKHYAENKHGRSEFQQIASRNNCTCDGSQNTDGITSFLYGYLGIVEDLDKLDLVTKKRCVVKSKKEIQAIAGESRDSK
ncbi:hypothetical protein Ddye_025334 [Dipteronia dyeriana]|uniref:XS domain-containing protein n=1 Tax=Dipteronia dyeriana TaxID=168575 RepID=A0AAD9TWP8_9ROSI|nr:hypothetical protein Ddye_025334 [Dipteronia dyeriana]